MNTTVTYRYKLDRSPKKYICPLCNKKSLVRYIDNQSGQIVEGDFGRCDRMDRCGFIQYPAKGADKYCQIKRPPVSEKIYMPASFIKKISGSAYNCNVFLSNMKEFLSENVFETAKLYHLGTITQKYYCGAVMLPFIDINGNLHAVQIKKFDAENHTVATTWLHTLIEYNGNVPPWMERYKNQDLKVSCLFGEHILSVYPNADVVLVEAPKSAIYSTAKIGSPDKSNLIFVSCLNLTGLTHERCKSLAGRNVLLYPDASISGKAYKLWKKKADMLKNSLGGNWHVSDFFEKNTTQIQKTAGYDIADWIQEGNNI